MKTLTISIAAYNIECYIEKCLDSFISDKLNNTLEVLIINDGSTDNTAILAEKYVKKYPAIFKLINKENGGHGSTINTGIKAATGKYFKAVDGDDWVDTENLVYIIEKLQNTDVDLVITDFCEMLMKSDIQKINNSDSLPQETTERFEEYSTQKLLVFHNVIYKTIILKDNDITMSEKIFFDDTEYIIYILPFINSFIYIPKVLYYYRLEREGQSVSVDGVIKHKKDIQQVLINSFCFYKKHKKNKNHECLKLRILSALNFYYEKTCTDLWLLNEKKNIGENQLFYKKLLFISPELFLSYMTNTKIKLLQLITWFRFDAQIFRLQHKWLLFKRKLLNKTAGVDL